MWKHRCLAASLIMCMCMSLAACGRNNADLYEQFEGMKEGEGGFEVSEIGEGQGAQADEDVLNYDTVGGGVSVFVSQNPYGENDEWYPNKDVFLENYGFRGQEPFYVYYDVNGRSLMALYYDEESGEGCGLRYYPYVTETFPEGDGIFGFTFQSSGMTEWLGYSVSDYTLPVSVYGGTGSESVKDYTEDIKYDLAGRVIHYASKGVVPELEELGVSEPETILNMDFTYYENGNLQSRTYAHSVHIFPTAMSSMESYFDENGRLIYEKSYITHGNVDNFYIYEGNDSTPRYCLTLDHMGEAWMPVFQEY